MIFYRFDEIPKMRNHVFGEVKKKLEKKRVCLFMKLIKT